MNNKWNNFNKVLYINFVQPNNLLIKNFNNFMKININIQKILNNNNNNNKKKQT